MAFFNKRTSNHTLPEHNSSRDVHNKRSIDLHHVPAARARPQKVTIHKTSFLGAIFRPIITTLCLLLAGYSVLTLGTSYIRSYNAHLAHTAPVHHDKTRLTIRTSNRIDPDKVRLLVRDKQGRLLQVTTGKSEAERFSAESLSIIEAERKKILTQLDKDINRLFHYSFATKEQDLEQYANWFFEWKRSYVILKETLTSTITRFFQTGKYRSLREAVEQDVQDYFMKNYMQRVLKPELRDPLITRGLEQVVRAAHENYIRVMTQNDLRLELFLARHRARDKDSVIDVSNNAQLIKLSLDWNAQKWKAPSYLAEDKAFDGIVGLGRTAASGTVGAVLLGPVVKRAMGRTFVMLSQRFASSIGTRIALAEKGAIAGTFVEPVGGQVVGAVVGVLLGTAADYFINKASAKFNRPKFMTANREALESTIKLWQAKLGTSVHKAANSWFDEARALTLMQTGMQGKLQQAKERAPAAPKTPLLPVIDIPADIPAPAVKPEQVKPRRTAKSDETPGQPG